MEIVVLPEEERSAEIRTLGILPASFPPGWLLWDMFSLPPDVVFLFTAAQVVFTDSFAVMMLLRIYFFMFRLFSIISSSRSRTSGLLCHFPQPLIAQVVCHNLFFIFQDCFSKLAVDFGNIGVRSFLHNGIAFPLPVLYCLPLWNESH